LLERAVQIFVAAGPARDPELAGTYNGLGNVARGRGDLAAARSHYEQALATLARQPTPDPVTRSQYLYNLSMTFVALEDFDRARVHAEEAVRELAPVLGPGSLRATQFRLEIGGVMREAGANEVARAFVREGLDELPADADPKVRAQIVDWLAEDDPT
jgi:tetratricopeptide (TPR) repeat protein